MSIFYKPDGTFYISSPNQRTQELDVIDDAGEKLYSLPSNQSPSDPNGNIILFNDNGTSSFVPLSAISPNSPSSYGTFSADPNPDIPSNSTYKFLFNQTVDSPISNVIINQDNNIVIQETGNYLFLIDTEGQTNAQGIDSVCLIQVLNNGSVINQALVGENAYNNSINTTLFQSTVSCNTNDEISIIITTQDTATSVNIRNLTFTINYIPPLIDATTNSSYGTFQIANETPISANLQYNFPLIQTQNSPIQSFTINTGNIQFQQAGNYLLILDTEGYVSNVPSTTAVFSVTRNGVPINPALLATNTYTNLINTTVFQSLITVAENDIIRVIIATQNTFGAIVNVRNLTVSLISLVIGGGGGGGNPNSLITSDSIQTPTQGAIIIADGTDPFLCHPTSLLTIDNEGLRINDAGNSEFTTLSTAMGQTYLINSGIGGITLNGASGDLTLTSTKFQGVVNINTSNGLKFNGVGLIKNDGNDLRVFNATGNTTIESKANNVILKGEDLKYENLITGANYSVIPIAQPSNNSIVQYQADGTCGFIPTPSGGGSTDAFINTDPLTVPPIGSVIIADGDDPFNATASEAIQVQPDGTVQLTNSNGEVVINSLGKLRLSGTGILLNDTARIENNGSYMYTAFSGGNIVYNAQNGGMVFQNRDPITFQNNETYTYTSILQGPTGNFSMINENAGGNFEFKALSGEVQFTMGAGAGCTFNGIGSINSSGSEMIVSNGSGNLQLSSKFNDVIVATEGGGKFQVNQGSEFQGDVNIAEDIPKLGFQSNLYPSNSSLISYDTKELLIQNNEATNTTLTYMNLQENDIILSTATQNGIIDMQVGSGEISINGNARFVPQLSNAIEFKNDNGDINVSSGFNVNLNAPSGRVRVGGASGAVYALPNTNPSDNNIMLFQSSGLSAFSSIPYPNQTQSFYVSKTGSDTVGSGSALLPFLTITYALSQADLLSASTKTTIYIFAGIYDESFTISKNNLTLSGSSAIPQQTQINGTISHNIDGAGSKIYSSLFGLTINGVNYNGSTYNDDASFVVGACVIGSVASIIPINITYSGTGIRDYTMNNTVLYAVDTNAIYINKGTINATACLFTETTTSNTNVIVEVVNSGLLNLFGTVVLSLNATASAPPVIRFSNNVASSCQFNSCTIGYAFGTIDTQVTKTKVCVACQNSGTLNLTVFNNKFDGTGSRIAYVGSNYVIISKAGAGALNIIYAQNIGTSNANLVHHYPVVAGATRTQLITVI
jgi:hypothetical protein